MPTQSEEIAALKDEVAYLRQRLADRLSTDLIRIFVDAFGLTPSEAIVVAVLYQARGIVAPYDIEIATQTDHAHDYVSSNIINVFVSRVRQKMRDPDFILTIRRHGFTLSGDGRRRVANAVEADRLILSPEACPLPAQTDRKPVWTSATRTRLYQLLRLQGRSYSEAAVVLGISRNAVASAAMRFGYQPQGSSL
jgi:hypothetical protein